MAKNLTSRKTTGKREFFYRRVTKHGNSKILALTDLLGKMSYVKIEIVRREKHSFTIRVIDTKSLI